MRLSSKFAIKDMNTNPISVIDAAARLEVEKYNVFKILKRLGIETFTERSSDPNHKGQAIAYITQDDFGVLQQEVISRSLSGSVSDSDDDYANLQGGYGFFYVIQLEPEHDPGRFKVGFAVSIPERLRSHRCSAPFAVVIKSWPCKRVWERTAIDCVTVECDQLHTEVFRTEDLDAVIGKCEQFFGLMPTFENGTLDGGADGEQSHALEPAAGSDSNGESSPPAQ
ncbi:GIY-YIG nuclease family protein [Cyanobium sp. LEGE 06113]|uniref:GIY-YIG nuclease family protein n=1 Tax=Cyanobium sp. LEGE 06113 TaxID=1297573 RepID=UPI001881E2F5|nr:GIY-YIG nuclease family protein [Cyanobium sp. LEGE 06113]MBE9152868.1 GIY-YIG nuclease family protein [Cyanobium sp. LEGE 06113]MBE9152927.1 GIY-YIG nuclease family protein [Cyanobium sp. LEGE 06113]